MNNQLPAGARQAPARSPVVFRHVTFTPEAFAVLKRIQRSMALTDAGRPPSNSAVVNALLEGTVSVPVD